MRLLRHLSIRARITVGSLVIGAVVLAGVAGVLHLQIRQATLATDQSLASGDAAPFVSDLRNNPDEPPDRPAEDVLVGIRDAQGRWIVDALPADVRRVLPDTVPDDQVVRRLHTDDRVVTVVGTPVTNDRGTFVVWAAHDGRAGQETLERVDRSLWTGTLLALAAFGGTAWLLSTLALRPVARLRRTAEDISAGRSGGHLPVGDSADELDDLARTLNAFIDRQRADADRERRMVSDASHELRTPLAALTARLELAHRESGDAAALERELSAAEVDAGRLVALADTLLELSRLDEDGPRPAAPASALVTELMASVDRARALGGVEDRDIDFDVDVPDPTTEYAITPAAFARVVDNLVANAVAAGSAGGVVRVALGQEARLGPDDRLGQDDRPGQEARLGLVLRVTDDGPGVPDDFLPRAFDRFTRADVARTSRLGGSGLGLALVRGVVERAGGTATLANGPQGGAVAVVRVPAR